MYFAMLHHNKSMDTSALFPSSLVVVVLKEKIDSINPFHLSKLQA